MTIRKIAEANTRSGELVGTTRVENPVGVYDKVNMVHIEGNVKLTSKNWDTFKRRHRHPN